ncbi:MAG: low molecular weight phosphotyrosine protein phosphatase, partial [Thauera sp.]|nr:low molecular weight phosphotyrosine protein phosphatase [Thauera sp.]
MTRVLFVCTGNICRSPTAEGVARHLIATAGLGDRVEVDSAGTHGYHVGEAPDPRTQKAARLRGYDLSGLRARKLEVRDFQDFRIDSGQEIPKQISINDSKICDIHFLLNLTNLVFIDGMRDLS